MGNASGRPSSLSAFKEKYSGNLVTGHNQSDLPDGVCHGMCLDWVRRLIHKGGNKFVQLVSSKDSVIVKRVITLQVQTHELFKEAAERANRSIIDRMKEVTAEMTQIDQRNAELRRTTRPLVVTERALTLVQGSGFLGGQDLLNLSTVVGGLKVGVDDRFRRIDGNEGRIELGAQEVQSLAGIMKNDEARYVAWFRMFRKLYRESFKDEPSFDKIGFGAATDPGDPASVDWFSRILACIRLLDPGQGALLNFRRDGGGHFVAFFYGGGNYHFFDPNVGWYQIETAAGIAELFHDLWHAAYQDMKYNASEWRVFQ